MGTWRVRSTLRARGERLEATGQVSSPVTAGAVLIVLWTHGTQGFVDACGATAQVLAGGVGNLFLATLGYAVAAPTTWA